MNKVRIMSVQMDVIAGHPRLNTHKMLQYVAQAKAEDVNIVIFPEMAVPGYLIGDEWEHESFLRDCEDCCNEIRKASKDIIVIFGSVGLDWKKKNEDGRVRKYNALFVAENRKFIPPAKGLYPFVIKTLMPNYRQFDDSRHFYDARKLAIEKDKTVADITGPVKTGGLSLGCVICEDAWDSNYGISPLAILGRHKTDMFVNISCSPYTVNKNYRRQKIFLEQSARLKQPFIYVNNIGIQNNGKTVFTFDGSSCFYDGHGNTLECANQFEEKAFVYDVPLRSPFGRSPNLKKESIGDVFNAICFGTLRFMDLCNAKNVVIGISGGIDSALVASIYSKILDRENILLVNMQGKYTSKTTMDLAYGLAQNIGCYYASVPIEPGVNATVKQIDNIRISNSSGSLSRHLELTPFMMENVQARDRSSRILAALSSAFGGVFTCNANKSESTIGYATFYGDLGGYFANIADLWKTEVYEMAKFINSGTIGKPIIPQGSFTIVPSAELSNDQNVDEGKGDPLIYEYHDCLFRSWVEEWNRATPEDILSWYSRKTLCSKIGYTGDLKRHFKTHSAFINDLERWWNQYQGLAVAKRIQAPPILAVKRRSFGFDQREAQMAPIYSKGYLRLREKLLSR